MQIASLTFDEDSGTASSVPPVNILLLAGLLLLFLLLLPLLALFSEAVRLSEGLTAVAVATGEAAAAAASPWTLVTALTLLAMFLCWYLGFTHVNGASNVMNKADSGQICKNGHCLSRSCISCASCKPHL